MTNTILLEVEQAIATVTLNRPEKLNAMTIEMYGRFGEVFDELSGNPEIRCVVVRGAGGRAFRPGSDIGEFDTGRTGIQQAKEYAEFTMGATVKLKNCPHPTIALIQGACVGGGLEIAAMCDIRICGESSRFGIPINRLGLTVDYDELQILFDAFGPKAVLEILLDARLFGAEEALNRGLVSRVCADDEVEQETYQTARRIADSAPLVNHWHKKFVRRLLDPRPLTQEERDEAYEAYETEDYRTGYQAFAEKRNPQFKGR
jgi:enoyl-CoA hydratase/carnithine racemase